jgi:hypothetical protein
MLLPFPHQWIHAVGLLMKNTPIANEADRKLCRVEAKAAGSPELNLVVAGGGSLRERS